MNQIQTFEQFLAEQSTGTYVGAKLSAPSVKCVKLIQELLGIETPVPEDKLHITVLYSRNPVKISAKEYSYEAQAKALELFKNSDGTKSALVLLLNCPALEQRHNELIALGGTHDFPSYQPHVTLCYDYKSGISLTNQLQGIVLQVVDEYVEPLDLDWSSKIS